MNESAFGESLRRHRLAHNLSLRGLGNLAHRSKSHLQELESGRKQPSIDTARHLDDLLGAGGRLVTLASTSAPEAVRGEDEALELASLLDASDVAPELVNRFEFAVDELASSYPTTAPMDLLPVVRDNLAQLGTALRKRTTLDQQRRLLVAAGWLALLRATLHIDLRHQRAADAHLTTAEQLAKHVGHAEIRAWSLETRAWDVLTAGDYRRALDLAEQARAMAPRGSSAHIQATAQTGRAWARMGNRRQTRRVLDEVERLVSPLQTPDRPEHHYQYDPAKALSYTATTLAWSGDPAAEEYARTIVADLDVAGRPRRAASARLDLGLALLAAGRPDEASMVTTEAITSGRVVPSNWWRATEVLSAVESSGIREANDLRDAYETHRPR
ncbi:helix-turn-helix domain-containing protein [Micromonospora sp. NBC_01796]|uniref:helix-turn-helix domain-containing protein n=1 Tax=Micromonospora sp. NBC_01796 TaxID=2975987 RepID=UPI002DDC3E05|nr:helix-turn-helix transcriptional regulator [Micromonospora sp. NBC_01796]WSA88609.1 helix-turn-helix domain-containing protein [Micromonospora sp. NBC_01796]